MDPHEPPPTEVPPQAPRQVVSYGIALLLALAPVLLLVYVGDVPLKWAALGSLSWILAVLLKIPAMGIVHLWLRAARVSTRAAVSGLLSGISELGLAAWLFRSGPSCGSELLNALTYGTAAGCTELLAVLAAGLFARPAADQVRRWTQGAQASVCVRHTFLIERGVALAGHVGARGLVSLYLYGGPEALAAVALVGFALTDGLAAYGSLKEWDWFDPSTCRRFFGICAAVSLVEVLCFATFGLAWL